MANNMDLQFDRQQPLLKFNPVQASGATWQLFAHRYPQVFCVTWKFNLLSSAISSLISRFLQSMANDSNPDHYLNLVKCSICLDVMVQETSYHHCRQPIFTPLFECEPVLQRGSCLLVEISSSNFRDLEVNSLSSAIFSWIGRFLQSMAKDLDLECSICLDVMVQPCTLGCGHSFCELCVDEAINIDDRCPECRQYTQGICIRNLRLRDIIRDLVSRRSREEIDRYKRRERENEAALAIRKRARAILFSVLYRRKEALTIEEIETEWRRLRLDSSPFNEKLKTEIERIINSNHRKFEVIDSEGGKRVSMKMGV